MATSGAIDLVGDSSDDSRSPSPPPTKPVRPKLRTRRAIAYEDEEDDFDNDEEMRAALRASANAYANANAQANVGTSRRSREQNTLAASTRDSDVDAGGDEVHEEDDDYEQADERTEEEDDEEEEDEEEEEDRVGRRRSGRARRNVLRSKSYDSEEENEGDFEIRVQPRRGRGGGDDGGGARGGGLEHSTRPRRAPPPKPSRPAASSTSRKRKRPSSSSSAKPKSKARKPRQRQQHSDEDEIKAASDSSDVEEDWLMSEDDEKPTGRGGGKDDDEIDENAFIVEKILAREVHTLKEWTRLRQNKTTRFLTNASIFLDDSDDEDEKKESTKPKAITSTEADGADDVVVVLDGPLGEPAQKEEERFLIKWKNLSYIHVSWETEPNLMDVDRNVKAKIQRFREKEMLGLLTDRMHGDEYFNPEFRDVDRILDIQDTPGDKYTPVEAEGDDDGEEDNGGAVAKPKLKYMLIKWKAQPYDAITWEREDDVHDDAAVQEYEVRLARSVARYKRLAMTPASKRATARKMPKFRGYSATNLPPFKQGQTFELRDYQLTGVNWMLFNWYQRRNSMLADEMGLGKTVQTVTYINHLAVVEQLAGPYLIVAPLSTLGHWQREFTNWTNLNAVVYHGSAEARQKIQDYEFFLSEAEYRKTQTSELSTSRAKLPKVQGGACYRFDVLITTYEMCSTPDFAKLARVKWQLLAVDEAHRLKNRNSKLSVLIHKTFNYENILLLTGTPLQNNVEELWTLLNFLDPARFDSTEDFLEDYGELKDVSQVEKLHGELKPFLLRRMKEDVEKSLAPKEETIIEVELTVLQKQYYRAIFEQNTEFLARGMKRSHAPSLMNVLMELRKCCNHPFLIRGMEQREVARLREQKDMAKDDMERQATELLVTASGKLILLDKLLPRLKENGHRVLIFSQFKIMLDILQDYLRLRAYRCERIDGNITGNDRQAAIDRFSDPASLSFIMLLSTRAGGVGINLTSADTVIIYDSDWNPQNDLQAQARCHRIGQKKSVKIYRLLTAKTYELHMFHQASLKLGLDQAVLGSIRDREQHGAGAVGTTKRPNAPMSKDEIENLLKHGAYEMFKEDKEGEAEAASKRFSEESIDQILSRSTKIIHDPKATGDEESNGKKSLMSSFSKATFVSSDNPDAQVALDDPEFWTKVIGLQQPEKVEPSPLKKRRCRREITSYVQDDSGAEEETKKAKGRGRPRKQDEEYVISSSSEEDDDDDEDGTEELADDDFENGGVPKPKKPRAFKVPKLPKLYIYHERLCEMLTTFGYGRWKEIAETSVIFKPYPLDQLRSFSQELIASLVRVAATSFLVAKNAPQPPKGMDGQLLLAAPLPPLPPTHQQLTDWLNLFAARYRFLAPMLADMRLQAISDVLVYSPGLHRTAPTHKAERDATTKLQQIERMYSIHIVVQQQIGPVAPMVALLKDLQRVKDVFAITKMVTDGVLPPHQSDALRSEKLKGTKAVDLKNAEDKSESLASKVSVGDGGVRVDTGATVSASDEAHKTAPTAADATTAIASAEAETRAESTEAEAPATSTVAESAAVDETVQDTKAKDDSASATDPSAVNKLSVSPTPLAENATSTAASEDSKSTVSDGGSSAPAAASGPTITIPTKPEAAATPSPRPATPTTPLIKQQHLRVALSRLQMLPDIGTPESVAPWWISLVDDVLLLLYVHNHGWLKARALPSSLLRDNSLFGTRAGAHAVDTWPAVPILNRRIRSLLGCWSNGKRLVAHASIVTHREKMRNAKAEAKVKAAATAAAIAEVRSLLVPPARPQSTHLVSSSITTSVASAHSAGMLTASSLMVGAAPQAPKASKTLASSTHRQPLQRTSSSDDDAEQRELAAKRMRFAKLVFQFGIPDMNTLKHSNQSQLDKWRAFREDPLLGVAQYPPMELLREAMDLERFCRVRQNDGPSTPLPPLSVPPQWSILGSRRGIWALTASQSRRLVHRIELFRTLRLELLVLPPQQLGAIIDRIIDEIYATDERATQFFPDWWGSPRHDVVLLQGVEHFGLDAGVRHVWALPQLVAANPTSSFPSATWVENHVHNIVNRAQRLLQQSRLWRRNHSTNSTSSTSSSQQPQRPPSAPAPPAPSLPPQQRADAARLVIPDSEDRQRFRDLHGMRQEDPQFSASAMKRKWRDKDEFEKRATKGELSSVSQSQAAAKEMLRALEEARKMKREDPHYSWVMRAEMVDQKREFQAKQKARAETQAKQPNPRRNGRQALPADAEVIDLDDEDDDEEEEAETEEKKKAEVQEKEDEEEEEEEEEEKKEVEEEKEENKEEENEKEEEETEEEDKEEKKEDEQEPADPPTQTEPTPSPETITEETSTDHSSPAKVKPTATATDAASREDERSSGDDAKSAASAQDDETASQKTTSAKAQNKRKRAPRSWEVIVIDDSDDNDDDDGNGTPVKRTTRSRRRRRGDGLTNGL